MLTATKLRGTVHHADDSNFDQLVLNSDVPVLVDFYADWCGPCRMLAPVLEELAKETPKAKIVKVNVDHAGQLARHYGIASIPNLKVFKDGKVVDEHVGLANKAHLKSLLDI
jgi:thioredoxin 1